MKQSTIKLEGNHMEIKNSKNDNISEDIECLYIQMRKPIFILVLSIVGDYHSAEDILQETFIKIITKKDTYKKGSNIKAWMFKIARNTALNYIKKSKFESPQEELGESGYNQIEAFEGALQFNEMIKDLDDLEKQIITLRLDGELTYIQISNILEISIINARAKYSRAIKKLKTTHNK